MLLSVNNCMHQLIPRVLSWGAPRQQQQQQHQQQQKQLVLWHFRSPSVPTRWARPALTTSTWWPSATSARALSSAWGPPKVLYRPLAMHTHRLFKACFSLHFMHNRYWHFRPQTIEESDIIYRSGNNRSGDNSGSVLALQSKGCRFESQQEQQDNFLHQGQLTMLTLILVSVPPPHYRSSM